MINGIASTFRSRGIIRGSAFLLPPAIALEFLTTCRDQGVQLLGFDAFRLLSGDRIQPIMEDSLDLSAQPFCGYGFEDSLTIAEEFIKQRLNMDIWFEMVTD